MADGVILSLMEIVCDLVPGLASGYANVAGRRDLCKVATQVIVHK